jgi:transcriptional regulator with XRE-family HTH domain
VNNTSQKISQIIHELKLNNNSFAKALGVTNPTIDGMTKGRLRSGELVVTKPSFDIIQKMVNTFGINPLFLFDLSDKMFLNDDKKREIDSFSESEIVKHVSENWERYQRNEIMIQIIDGIKKDEMIDRLLKEKQKLMNSKNQKNTAEN